MAQRVISVVISGGSGTRLWPVSTEDRPKQFHNLTSDRSLLQETAARLASSPGLDADALILVCNRRHAALARRQLEEMGRPPAAVILEPFGRNTAAVAMSASLVARAIDPEALVLLAPSDHVMARPEAFDAAIKAAQPAARDHFVLFGVIPTSPETGYGYIELGEPLDEAVWRVARFVEKPDVETAQAYIDGGRHLWNAGIFLFAPNLMIREMELLAPEVGAATRRALDCGPRSGATVELDAEAFAACPSVSLDVAVMERTDRATVIALDSGWSDIGSWSALWALGPHDQGRNLVRGDVELVDTEGCLVWSEGKTIAVLGVSDLVIVQTETAIVVAPKSRAQDIRRLVERMAAKKSS